jgi:hypothetical protein
MHFLVKSCCETTPNSEMDEEQIIMGEEFLDKLVLLGVLIKVALGRWWQMSLCSVYQNLANQANGAFCLICGEAARTKQLVPILQSSQNPA